MACWTSSRTFHGNKHVMARVRTRNQLSDRRGSAELTRLGFDWGQNRDGVSARTRSIRPQEARPAQTLLQSQVNTGVPHAPNCDRPSTNQAEQPTWSSSHLPPWVPPAEGILGPEMASAPTAFLPASPRPPATASKQIRNMSRSKQPMLPPREASDGRASLRDKSHRKSSSSLNPQIVCTPHSSSPDVQSSSTVVDSPLKIEAVQKVELPKITAQKVTIYPELDRYQRERPIARTANPAAEVPYRIATQNLPPLTPLFSETNSSVSGFSVSSSTRFSESPGLGSYSRDTTPTSVSSHSPGVVAPMQHGPLRLRQAADHPHPMTPSARRRAGSAGEVPSSGADPHGLAAAGESVVSPSSQFGVKARVGDKRGGVKKGTWRSSVAPRESSQTLRKSQDANGASTQHANVTLDSSTWTPAAPPKKNVGFLRPPPSLSHGLPPPRPSRDGTSDLHSRWGLSPPIIYSNLSSNLLSQKLKTGALVAFPSSDRSGLTSARIRGREAACQRSLFSRKLTPSSGHFEGATTAPTSPTASATEDGMAVCASSPGVSISSRSLFPFFTHKVKASAEPDTAQDKEQKPERRGPAAGSGHEGYGCPRALRCNSGPIPMMQGPPGTMSFQENLSSTQNSFLMEPMAPVAIAAGDIMKNRNKSAELNRTGGNQYLCSSSRPGPGSQSSLQVSLSSHNDTQRVTLWPSVTPRDVHLTIASKSSVGLRRPSRSSDSEGPVPSNSTFALRSSVEKFKSGEQRVRKMLKPIVTRPRAVLPSFTSLDTTMMSDDSMFDGSINPPFRAEALDATPHTYVTKTWTTQPKPSRRWNLFGRSPPGPASPTARRNVQVPRAVSATVNLVSSRPVAYHALMESSEQEDVDPEDFFKALGQARVDKPPVSTPTAKQHGPSLPGSSIEGRSTAQGSTPSSPLKRSGAASRAVTKPPRPTAGVPNVLPSSVQSSSTASAAIPRPGGGRPSKLPHGGRTPKVLNTRVELVSAKSFSRSLDRPSIHTSPSQAHVYEVDSFIKRPSQASAAVPQTPASEQACLANVGSERCVDVIPKVDAPLAEDEIWDEYNDLLGEDATKTLPGEWLPFRKPMHHSVLNIRSAAKNAAFMELPTIKVEHMQSLGAALGFERHESCLSQSSTEPTARVADMPDDDDQPSSTAFPMSEFMDGHGVRNISVESTKQRAEAQQCEAYLPAGKPQQVAIRRSNASGSSQDHDDSSTLSQIHLRLASMEVSKWLTFGHVLFSPARDELVGAVASIQHHSILVIDGLGNDDWSFYAAETYPAAPFFNLSPRAPLLASRRNSVGLPSAPLNHHQVQYKLHTDKFPIGSQCFTLAIIRFPKAAPESHYRNIISETRRVLKPGGFIELFILDFDLNSMGTRARRAIRQAKEAIYARYPDTYLGSISDLFIKHLGQTGFTDIKTCRIGVPVVSANAPIKTKRPARTASEAAKHKSKEGPESLAEMRWEEGVGAEQSMTKMVSKVGRWWYSRCYGSASATIGSQKGLWSDRTLLKECEDRGTSFKLLVCHARASDGLARLASI